MKCCIHVWKYLPFYLDAGPDPHWSKLLDQAPSLHQKHFSGFETIFPNLDLVFLLKNFKSRLILFEMFIWFWAWFKQVYSVHFYYSSFKFEAVLNGQFWMVGSKRQKEPFHDSKCYTVAGENVRASREKSGNQRLANLPTCYYKYVYVILCIQSCPILRGINISSSTIQWF